LGEALGERFEWLLPIIAVSSALLFIGFQIWKRKRQESQDSKIGSS